MMLDFEKSNLENSILYGNHDVEDQDHSYDEQLI